ncbi:hypothetical protein IQ235_06115 [Oscillatoriales cyanobacterium LEGE 11467]|uniref:Uncharacterized protein n=1 Tax=Zarconia navalis LEGE 11467 TaxID=1828826 RepID=A0A928VY23_9CYAN|nr:hypothetical protein [Zarconia navalis]MBE9040366.1 hypothetical protein [Zarconia navalis LEGE 11467]
MLILPRAFGKPQSFKRSKVNSEGYDVLVGSLVDLDRPIWGAPEDFFCLRPNPEISNRSCQRQFPEKTDIEHRCWVVELMLFSDGTNAFLRTRLGYTYD